jgi:hypothetical protein
MEWLLEVGRSVLNRRVDNALEVNSSKGQQCCHRCLPHFFLCGVSFPSPHFLGGEEFLLLINISIAIAYNNIHSIPGILLCCVGDG